jgi:hypothetical protein
MAVEEAIEEGDEVLVSLGGRRYERGIVKTCKPKGYGVILRGATKETHHSAQKVKLLRKAAKERLLPKVPNPAPPPRSAPYRQWVKLRPCFNCTEQQQRPCGPSDPDHEGPPARLASYKARPQDRAQKPEVDRGADRHLARAASLRTLQCAAAAAARYATGEGHRCPR